MHLHCICQLQLCAKMLSLLLLLLLAIGVLGPGCQADCNVCAASTNVACVSETQFAFCENNLPVQPINSCPTGTYCTAESTICQSNSALTSCNECGLCNGSGTFACLGVRTFALCLGSDTVSPITGSCAPNYICNRNDPNICSLAALGSQATCPLVNDELSTTMTPPTTADPNTYCRFIMVAGRYPYGTNLSTTCRQYILCYVYDNIWNGVLYQCPGQTYFQPTSRLCNTTIPSTCQVRVNNLHIQNLRLL